MTRILLASRNAKKLGELRRILGPALPELEVVGLEDVPPYPELPETGATFAANALIKAREGFRVTGLPTVADDSGLCVEALNGMPGVLSARWAGAHGDDEANLRLVLAQLRDTPDDRLRAAFECAVAYVCGDGELVTHGRMPGRLIREPRGANGFGYDPIFVPDGDEQTSAELDPAVKDSISHRGQALRALAAKLARAGGQAQWTVTPLRAADRSAWEPLYRGYAEFYGEPMPADKLDLVWSWLHDPAHELHGFAVRADRTGAPVGIAHVRTFARPLDGSAATYLDDLFVAPEHRGSGAVDAVFAALVEHAAAQGHSVVRWITREDNARARAVYDRVAQLTPYVTYDLTAGT